MQTIERGILGAYMKLIILISIVCLFGACAKPPIVEYKYVNVPVRCDIGRPARPAKDNDTALAVIDLIAYTRKLEITLNACMEVK
jgi:hypothetical protein